MRTIARTTARNIPALYLYSAFRGFFFSVPVIVLFWQANGLSIPRVMALQSLFSLLVVALEVPSGYLADATGRTRVLVLSGVAQTAAIGVYSLGRSFTGFLAGEALFAIAISLSSGADAAFLFDTLKSSGREEEYPKIMGRTRFFELVTLGLANAAGGFIGELDLRLTVLLSVPFFALTIPASLVFVEPGVQSGTRRKELPSLALIRRTVLENRDARRLIVFGAVLFAFTSGGLWLYQPYFSLCGLPVWSFGLVFASFHLVAGLSARSAARLMKKLGTVPLLAGMAAAVISAYILMGSSVFPLAFLFVYLQQWVRGTEQVVIGDAMNRYADSSVRATILSVQSLAGRLGYSALLPLVGLAADRLTVPQAFLATGAAGAAALALAFAPLAMSRRQEAVPEGRQP